MVCKLKEDNCAIWEALQKYIDNLQIASSAHKNQGGPVLCTLELVWFPESSDRTIAESGSGTVGHGA